MIGCLALLLFALAQSTQAQDSPDDRFIDGLLERGLVQVAEQECLRKLRADRISSRDRVDWTVRLSQSFCRHAELSSGSDREAFWKRAKDVLVDALGEGVPVGLREPLLVQQTIVDARRASMLHWEVRLIGTSSVSETQVFESAENAISALADARMRLSERLKSTRGKPNSDSATLSSGDIRRLIQTVELHRAIALVDAAEFPAPQRDVVRTLADADRSLRDIAKGWTGDPQTWDAILQRVRISRIEGNREKVEQQVRNAKDARPASWLEDRFIAELVRVDLKTGEFDTALETLLTHGRSRGRLSDELIALQVEALLDSRTLALQQNDKPLAEELQQRAVQWMHQASDPWRLRAEWLMTRSQEQNTYGVEIAKFLADARSAYQRQDIASTLTAYAEASETALEQNRPELADEFDLQRGSLLLQQDSYDDALAAFSAILTRNPHGTSGAKASLMAAFVRGKQYEAAPSAEFQQVYVSALNEHRSRYPSDPTTIDATWMLATFEDHRDQWTSAIALYQEIARSPERGVDAQLRIAVLFARVLERLRELEQFPDEWEDRAVEQLSGYVQSYQRAPDPLSNTQTEVTVRLARLMMNHRQPDYVQADRLLQRVQQSWETIRRAHGQSEQPVPC